MTPPAWIAGLTVAPSTVDAHCSVELLERTAREIGPGPTAWALDLGERIGRRALEEFVELQASAHQSMVMLEATESVALAIVRCLAADDLRAVREVEIAALINETVRRRVPLQDLERIMRTGHVWWSEIIMRTCAEGAVDGSGQASELHRVTHLLLTFMNELVDLVSDAYEAERTTWARSYAARQVAIVTEVLDDPHGDHREVGSRLGYQLHLRHHVAAVVWIDDPATAAEADLAVAADTCLTAWGAQQVLTVPDGGGTLWAWGNRPSALKAPTQVPRLPAGVRVATGPVGSGSVGFADSHRRALEVRSVLSSAVGVREPVVPHRDVAILEVMLRDQAAARRFVDEELGALGAPGAYQADLRRTVLAFLELRSPQAVGARLFVARNTVTYRLRQAEELLGHGVLERPFELWAALRILQSTASP